MNGEHSELDIPDGVAESKEAVEIMRGWIGDGALHLSLNADAFGGHIVDWGRVLGQIAHHVARASALNGELQQHEALQAIRAGFEATLPERQPAMSGAVRGRTSH